MMIHYLMCIAIVYGAIQPKQLKDFYSKWIDIDYQVESGYATNLQSKINGVFYQLVYHKGTQSDTVKETTPFIVWLQGGPGCGSQTALYSEMGPFEVTKEKTNEYTIKKRKYSWNEFSTILFIDQPIGAGYSYGETKITNTKEASLYFIDFMADFLKLHPEFVKSPMYLIGYSYAGHFVPYFAEALLKSTITHNFKGIAVGNGLTDTFNQLSFYSSYLYSNGYIDESDRDQGKQQEARAQQLILQDRPSEATLVFDQMLATHSQTAHIDSSNISYKSATSRNSDWFEFMNTYKDAFGINQGIIPNVCNDKIEEYFIEDISISFANSLSTIFAQGHKVLLYNGNMDFGIANGGVQNWMNRIPESIIEQWKQASKNSFKLNNNTVGTYKKTNQFIYSSIYNAGHVAIFDQPEVCSAMIQHFLNNDDKWI